MMVRLRMGQTLLSSTQFRAERRASGECMWCSSEEKVQNAPFQCLRYGAERDKWKE